MVATCDKLGGKSFSRYCAVEGVWTQLTTRLPGQSSWQTNFPSSTCDSLGGEEFSRFCIVQGEWTQVASKLPGYTSWNNLNSADCARWEGTSFGGSELFCAVPGKWKQLTVRLPGMISYQTSMLTTCNALEGDSFSYHCLVDGSDGDNTGSGASVSFGVSWVATFFLSVVTLAFSL